MTVVVTFRAEPDVREALEEELSALATLVFLEGVPPEGRSGALAQAAALISWNPPKELRAEELSGAGPFIQLMSAGANHVDFGALPSSTRVAGNTGAYAEPMAEHVLAMALALAKRLPQKHAELARGEFRQRPPTRAVRGLVCGILGFGGIGKAVAGRLRPLGVRIQAINTSGKTDEDVEFAGTLADLDQVVAASDIVVIALPLTRTTRGLIGRRELGLMRPDAILINVARGAIVQEDALYEHLRENPGFMAGIDAWWTEPFADGGFRTNRPFFELPNLLGSPHNSAIVPGVIPAAARRAARNVARHLRGEPVRGLVRREDYA